MALSDFAIIFCLFHCTHSFQTWLQLDSVASPVEEAGVLIQWVFGFWGTVDASEIKCEIPCKQLPYPGLGEDKADVLVSFPMEESPRHNSRHALSIGHTMESMHLYGAQHADKYDATATMDVKSTLPWPYFSWQNFRNLQSERMQQPQHFPGFHDRQPRAVFVCSNCEGEARNQLLTELSQAGVPIDSIGACKPKGTIQARWPSGIDVSDKLGALKTYRVYMAFENVMERGYVTEKIRDGYAAGNVNVYLGASDISEYVPSDSFVDANGALDKNGTINRDGLQALVRKMKAALYDELAWNKYFKFYSKPMNEWNAGNYDKTWSWSKEEIPGQCRMCRLAFARRAKGARFNTTTQQVEGVVPPPIGHDFWRTTWRSSAAQVEVPQ